MDPLPFAETFTLKYIVVETDRGFVAQCLKFDVSTPGADIPEAIRNLSLALVAYLADGAAPAEALHPGIKDRKLADIGEITFDLVNKHPVADPNKLI